jgi:hypothetical protein
MGIAYYFHITTSLLPVFSDFLHPFFAITVRNGNSVLFPYHNAPYKKKPVPDSSLLDLPRDKHCRAMVCQGFASETISVVLPMPGFPVRRRFLSRDMGD